MCDYIKRLASASREELEEPVRQSVKEAIRQAHSAGLATVGVFDGKLVMCHPDGRITPYHPDNGGLDESVPD